MSNYETILSENCKVFTDTLIIILQKCLMFFYRKKINKLANKRDLDEYLKKGKGVIKWINK